MYKNLDDNSIHVSRTDLKTTLGINFNTKELNAQTLILQNLHWALIFEINVSGGSINVKYVKITKNICEIDLEILNEIAPIQCTCPIDDFKWCEYFNPL